jgi:hypothetical protein
VAEALPFSHPEHRRTLGISNTDSKSGRERRGMEGFGAEGLRLLAL